MKNLEQIQIRSGSHDDRNISSVLSKEPLLQEKIIPYPVLDKQTEIKSADQDYVKRLLEHGLNPIYREAKEFCSSRTCENCEANTGQTCVLTVIEWLCKLAAQYVKK